MEQGFDLQKILQAQASGDHLREPVHVKCYCRFMFDPVDSITCYLISFQLLRIAFRKYLSDWQLKYKVAKQFNDRWTSQCVFVPACIVESAISEISKGNYNN